MGAPERHRGSGVSCPHCSNCERGRQEVAIFTRTALQFYYKHEFQIGDCIIVHFSTVVVNKMNVKSVEVCNIFLN